MGKGTGVCNRPALELGGELNDKAERLDAGIFARCGIWTKNPETLAQTLAPQKLTKGDLEKRLEELFEDGYFYKHFTKTYSGLNSNPELEIEYRFTELGIKRRSREIVKELSLYAQDVLGALGELSAPNQAKVAASLGLNRKDCAQAFKELLAKDLIERTDKKYSGVYYDLSADGQSCRKEMLEAASPWTELTGESEKSQSVEQPTVVAPEADLKAPEDLGRAELEILQEKLSSHHYYNYPTHLNLSELAKKLELDEPELEAKLDSLLKVEGISKTLSTDIFLKDGKEHQAERLISYQITDEAKTKLRPQIYSKLTAGLSPLALDIADKISKGGWSGQRIETLAKDYQERPEEFIRAMMELTNRGYLVGKLTLSPRAPQSAEAP